MPGSHRFLALDSLLYSCKAEVADRWPKVKRGLTVTAHFPELDRTQGNFGSCKIRSSPHA